MALPEFHDVSSLVSLQRLPFAIARAYGYFNHLLENTVLISIGLIMMVLILFYWCKRCFYYLLGVVFTDAPKYKFWKTNYNAIIGAWGICLYIPALWLVFVGSSIQIPVLLFVFFYILCRFVIIYKTIRIFHRKNSSFLYISLYLCGQGILPLVFLYEGIIHLYNFIESSTLWH